MINTLENNVCDELHTIILSLSLSYISGYIFYYLTIFMPRNEKDKIILHALSPVFYILKYITYECTNNFQYNVNYNNIQNLCNEIILIININEQRLLEYYNFLGIIIHIKTKINTVNELAEKNNISALFAVINLNRSAEELLHLFPDHAEIIDILQHHLENNPFLPLLQKNYPIFK